jgi:hypothetical protein
MLAGGTSFVVVWETWDGAGPDTEATAVHGQRYDGAGLPIAGEFEVNSYTPSLQYNPDVAMDAAGGFVVVWQSAGSAGSDIWAQSVHAQRYDSTGAAVGGEFQVNTYTPGYQGYPSLAMDAGGDFTVVWSSAGGTGSDTDGRSIQAQRYDASGTPVGGEVQVNTYTTGRQWSSDIAMEPGGGFVVVWASGGGAGSDTSDESVQARRYDASGTPGGQFQVNTYTTDAQNLPAVAMDASASFVVAWSGGASYPTTEIFAQRFVEAGGPTTTTTSVTIVTTSTTSSTSSTSSTLPSHLILGKRLTASDPAGAESSRRLTVLAKETATDIGPTIAGDPTASGATLRLVANGMTASDQTYVLDAGGWSAIGALGFRYSGPTGGDGDPVKKIVLKRTPGGTALVRLLLRGDVGSQNLDVVPPNPGSDGAFVLEIPAGARYCAGFGGAAGGTVARDTATQWKVVNATAEPGCPVASTTTTTLPSCPSIGFPCGSCGGGLCGIHADPDPPVDLCTSSSSCFNSGCTDDGGCPAGFVCMNPHPVTRQCCTPCP